MGYGSLFATIITLFLVPLCYLAVDDLGSLIRAMLGSKNADLPPSTARSPAAN
jgi:hypothetical protein